MSQREKRLLILLLSVLFLIVNGVAYRYYYEPKMRQASARLSAAEVELETSAALLEAQDAFSGQEEWLERYEPTPVSAQVAQTKLQSLAESEAKKNQLEIKRQDLQPTIQHPSLIYHRTKVAMQVTGRESGLYRWLTRLHSPTEFRAVTSLKMQPLKSDDTMIDCTIVVEQWFVPEDTSTASR